VFEAGDLTVAAFGLTDQSEEFAAAESEPGTAFATLDPSVSATRSLVEEILDSAAAHDPDLVVALAHWGPNWETEPRRSTRRSAGGSSIRASTVHGQRARPSRGRGVPRATDYL